MDVIRYLSTTKQPSNKRNNPISIRNNYSVGNSSETLLSKEINIYL